MSTRMTHRNGDRRAVDLEALFPGRFISVTSFKRNGNGVATPVWAASDGARLYAFTDLNSAKVRRIRRNPTVRVAPCRAGGKLLGTPVPAEAEILTSDEDLARVQALLLNRYRISYRVAMLFYRLGRRLRGKTSVAEGAALAIALRDPRELSVDAVGPEPVREAVLPSGRGSGTRADSPA